MKKYTISYLNKKYAASTQNGFNLPNTPNTYFMAYNGHHIPIGSAAYCQRQCPSAKPPKKQDIMLVCNDGNKKSWGTLFFRELEDDKVLFVFAFGRDCWGDWFTHWEKVGEELENKEFEAIMREIALFYRALQALFADDSIEGSILFNDNKINELLKMYRHKTLYKLRKLNRKAKYQCKKGQRSKSNITSCVVLGKIFKFEQKMMMK